MRAEEVDVTGRLSLLAIKRVILIY
jgi:hypothetical protein